MYDIIYFYTVLLFTLLARADFDGFYFASAASNWRCPGIGFDCRPPAVCTFDSLINKAYCCDGGPNAVCWTGNTKCGGSDNTPTSNQLSCGSFCCLNTREECTQRLNQINICWATAQNPLAKLSQKDLNSTFSSLSSAQPSATAFSFDLTQLISSSVASSTPAPSSTSASISSAASSSATSASAIPAVVSSTPTQTKSPSDGNNSISVGTVAGIVVGVVIVMLLVGAGAFIFWKRKRQQKPEAAPYMLDGRGVDPQTRQAPHAQAPPTYASGTKYEMYAYVHDPGQPPVEMDASSHALELDSLGHKSPKPHTHI